MTGIPLHNGHQMPAVGFGTWQIQADVTAAAVRTAISAGYRHVDTAYAYQNEAAVGQGIREATSDGKITREELFVTTKLWNKFHRKDLVREAFMESLRDLKLSYVDLFHIHWPVAFKEDGPTYPRPPAKIEFSDADYTETYKELEKLVDEGYIRSLGLSNFNSKQIQRVLDTCRIKPAVVQVECHPYCNQQPLVDWCRDRGITFTAYSSLGSPDRPWAEEGEKMLVNEDIVKKIAAKYNKSPAQVLIRYPLDRGLSVVVKSATPQRIVENLQVRDFQLSAEDMSEIQSLHTGERRLLVSQWSESKYYPFKEVM